MMEAPDQGTTTAWLIRHGESVANAGLPVSDFAQIPLTELGEQQAEIFAARFRELSTEPPTRIVHSPYLRAGQTAEPLCRRFPEVPVEIWPVYEFTYLDPIATAGLTDFQRSPHYTQYWERDDPVFREKNGAESFTDFMDRVRGMLQRLEQLRAGERVPIFCHGYFMQAVRLVLLFPERPDKSMMAESRMLNDNEPIANTEFLEVRVAKGKARLVGQDHITPLTLEPIQPHR